MTGAGRSSQEGPIEATGIRLGLDLWACDWQMTHLRGPTVCPLLRLVMWVQRKRDLVLPTGGSESSQ